MKSLQILTLNSEWSSQKGGVSTLNRELCIALAKANHNVFCYVPFAQAVEIDEAKESGVTLVVAPAVAGLDWHCRLCLDPKLKISPDVIIGHDHITGSQLHALGEHFYPKAKRVLMVHTSPEEIEWSKKSGGSTQRAQRKVDAQIERASQTDLIVAVGPRLYRLFQAAMQGSQEKYPKLAQTLLHQLNPGLIKEIEDGRTLIEEVQVLVQGRAEDFDLKGIGLARDAFAEYKNSLDATHRERCVFVVRGAEEDNCDELKQKLINMNPKLPGQCIRVRQYSGDRIDLRGDLRQASIMLMPSQVEGYGLVGQEAIAAGVPVLITASSGLAELLYEKLPTDADSMVLPSGVLKSSVQLWGKRIQEILQDRVNANIRANLIRDKLILSLKWDQAVTEFEQKLEQIILKEVETV